MAADGVIRVNGPGLIQKGNKITAIGHNIGRMVRSSDARLMSDSVHEASIFDKHGDPSTAVFVGVFTNKFSFAVGGAEDLGPGILRAGENVHSVGVAAIAANQANVEDASALGVSIVNNTPLDVRNSGAANIPHITNISPNSANDNGGGGNGGDTGGTGGRR